MWYFDNHKHFGIVGITLQMPMLAFEAESVAYSVCAYYGIETDANSFGYLANYTQGKSIAELKASLDLIGRTADELITDIDRHYMEIMAEREVAEIADEIKELPDPLVPVDVMHRYGYTDADMLPIS